MDVELQIQRHLARDARPTVGFIDNYCSHYKSIFPEVRSYECFKYLHLGMLSAIKRKSLPEIANVVGINSTQSLHHFIAQSPWSVEELRKLRLSRILCLLKGNSIIVVVDETGDRKKGKTTDYVARQYLGSVGKVDRGIVTVNAYGIYLGITFPLIFKIFKPKGTLKPNDEYKTKIAIATEIIDELVELGFKIELVLGDSLYGEANSFLRRLDEYSLPFAVAIRSNHSEWMPANQRVRANKWHQFERTFSNDTSETRYIREIIFGKKRKRTSWEITTDPETMPPNSTSFVMTNIQGKVKKRLGNFYGLRTWVEYGFRQCKQELGWTEYRFTKYREIQRWWEVIFSAYLMIGINALSRKSFKQPPQDNNETENQNVIFSSHTQWDMEKGWKNTLNNLRLIIQPTIVLWLIWPWLEVFPNHNLLLGLHNLIGVMNQFSSYYPDG
ncbi:MAG: IS701 family transposase [Coleofasciculaceae cyanobacterium]